MSFFHPTAQTMADTCSKQQCTRCGQGIDSDGDGNCAFCWDVSDEAAARALRWLAPKPPALPKPRLDWYAIKAWLQIRCTERIRHKPIRCAYCQGWFQSPRGLPICSRDPCVQRSRQETEANAAAKAALLKTIEELNSPDEMTMLSSDPRGTMAPGELTEVHPRGMMAGDNNCQGPVFSQPTDMRPRQTATSAVNTNPRDTSQAIEWAKAEMLKTPNWLKAPNSSIGPDFKVKSGALTSESGRAGMWELSKEQAASVLVCDHCGQARTPDDRMGTTDECPLPHGDAKHVWRIRGPQTLRFGSYQEPAESTACDPNAPIGLQYAAPNPYQPAASYRDQANDYHQVSEEQAKTIGEQGYLGVKRVKRPTIPDGSIDAAVWAKAFMEHNAMFQIAKDEATMFVWFANAINTAYDAGRRQIPPAQGR